MKDCDLHITNYKVVVIDQYFKGLLGTYENI